MLLLEFSLSAPKMFQNIPSFSRYFEQQIHQNVSSADIEGEKKKKKSVHRTRSEDPFLLVNIKVRHTTGILRVYNSPSITLR